MGPTYAQLRLDLASALSEFMEFREAYLESLRWFEEGLGRSRNWLAVHGEAPIPEAERRLLSDWMRRRRTGEPWAYILGWDTFRKRRFKVDPRVLIPRPETELVLEAALELGRKLGLGRVVDVGTGSGILALSLALETPWKVTATDLSAGALEVAKANATALGARVDFLQGDLLEEVPDPLELVLSNPPYVDPADRPSLQRELAFEPELALFAEDHGLAVSTRLLVQAFDRMAMACVLEIGAGQGEELVARARRAGWPKAESRSDFAGHDRILLVSRA